YQYGREPVEAKGNPAHRGCAELQRLEEKSEPGSGLLLADTDEGEESLLHGLLMDADGPARGLLTVQNQVIGLGPCASGFGIEQRQIFVARRRERVMNGIPALLVLVPLDEREVDDPREHITIDGNQVESSRKLHPQASEHRRHDGR